MPESQIPDAHLGVITNERTGRFHGALWLNNPTPSGCPRYMLRTSVTEGFDTLREAAASANAAFPTIAPLDVEAYASEDVALDGIRVPRGATITRLTTQRSADSMEGAADVEVSLGRRVLDVAISKGQFERMRGLGLLQHESGSGRDPELHYHYDHYVLSPLGRTRFEDRTRRRKAA